MDKIHADEHNVLIVPTYNMYRICRQNSIHYPAETKNPEEKIKQKKITSILVKGNSSHAQDIK